MLSPNRHLFQTEQAVLIGALVGPCKFIMDLIRFAIMLLIFFLENNGSQRGVFGIGEILKIHGDQCVDYLNLKDKTNVDVIDVQMTSMQYFPEGDCNSTAPDEELRVLELPNLKILKFLHNKLFKMPNVSGMNNLDEFHMRHTLISTIPGKPFYNNKLKKIDLARNKLVVAPDLDGAPGTLEILRMTFNRLNYIPNNYFEGCTKLEEVQLQGNQLKSFPSFAPIGSSLITIHLSGNRLNETIPKDAIAMHPNLEKLHLKNNQMPAFVISFCNLTKQLDCQADNNPLVTVENPYRDCIASISTLPKPKLSLTEMQLLSCDEKICWMKQHGFTTENVNLGICPDGREWKYVTKEELCPG